MLIVRDCVRSVDDPRLAVIDSIFDLRYHFSTLKQSLFEVIWIVALKITAMTSRLCQKMLRCTKHVQNVLIFREKRFGLGAVEVDLRKGSHQGRR